MPNVNERLKVVLVGPTKVGKTSLICRFAKGEFPQDLRQTIGADFSLKSMTVADNGKEENLVCWDTAGQERFGSMAQIYTRSARVIIAVIDNDVEKLEAARRYFQAFCQEGLQDDSDNKPALILCVNKTDVKVDKQISSEAELDDFKREVFGERAEEVTTHFCSAKTGKGVEELFEIAANQATGLTGEGFVAVKLDDDSDASTAVADALGVTGVFENGVGGSRQTNENTVFEPLMVEDDERTKPKPGCCACAIV